ncbi:toprim domain-containing protein [Paenibacillus sediminis]|uniref:DNA primase n=1 Tax=Paenibacillus sediminis TaxID=664909 RepID=A0ABS4H6H5_9BACL|nr:toprim domain-containing protein [Paenibacillus sediminis]MBP1938138.1 DNA primase [Paenibacillus sediminis]
MQIDVREELEQFEWTRATWTDDRLTAASPFRYDSHPSFYVYLTNTSTANAGNWGDPGATDAEYQRGGIVKLLAFLRNETTAETLDYLRSKYGNTGDNAEEEPKLRPLNLTLAEPYRPLDIRMLDAYNFRHPYLTERGITEPVQRLMRIGYDRDRKAVVIPWFNPNGTLGAIKFRKVGEKTFWYAKGGRPIREMVYGLDVIYRKRIRRAAIVESETDAMTLMSAGIPAIATGGAKSFNAIKRDMILRSPIEELIVIRDNDAAGRAWRNRVVGELVGRIRVQIVLIPLLHKDVNELMLGLGIDALKAKVNRSRDINGFARLRTVC